MSLWSKNDEHLIPFHSWPCFNFTDVRKILFQFFQNARAQFTVRHFAAAKPDGGFHFVAFVQPLARRFHAVVVIVIVGTRSELDFLDRYRYLLLLCLVRLLLRFVLILSEIDDPANGRIGIWSDLDEIEPLLPGGTHRIAHVHHAQLFSLRTNDARLGHAMSFVNTNWRLAPVIRALSATSKACSYCCTS